MDGFILMNVILLTVLLPTKCCSIPSLEGSCSGEILSYGGRMLLVDDGDVGDGDSPPPWANQKIFIFRMPPSFFKRGHRPSIFRHTGVGRIWMSNNGMCPGDPSHQVCPSIVTQNPDPFCVDPSSQCNEVLDNIELGLSSNSVEDGIATIIAKWSYNVSANSCLNVEEQHITIQQLDRGGCANTRNDPLKRVLDTVTRTYTQNGRRAYSMYQVTIFVKTNTGVYNQSAQIRTVSTKPTGPPFNIRRSNCNGTSDNAIIRWNKPPCSNRNGIITRFDYEIERTSLPSLVTNTSQEFKLNVTSLQANERFSVKVRAVNEKGAGPYAIYNEECPT